MFPQVVRRGLAAISSLAIAGTIAIALPTSADAAASRAYGGSSYGISAKFGNLISVGRTANQPLCTTASNVTRSNNTAAVNLAPLGTVGAQVTKVQSKKVGTTQSSITTSSTAGLNLLSGLITADAIVAKATVTLNSSGYSQKGETTFVNLKVGTVNVPVRPAPNTTINLPLGIGQVIVNQQGTLNQFGLHSQGVNGLVVILNNTAPVPAGKLVVSYALASLHSPAFRRAYGVAYATKLQVGSVIQSGASAAVHLPCGGSSGVTRTNNLAGVNLPGILTVGAGTTTAKSTDSAASTNARTTAQIGAVNLLSGVVTADAVKAVSSTTRKGSSLSRSSAGTSIVDLRINGNPVGITVGPNTKVNIAGVGTLYLQRSIWDKDGLQVIALQLVLGSPQGSLPAGAVLTAGYAQSGVV